MIHRLPGQVVGWLGGRVGGWEGGRVGGWLGGRHDPLARNDPHGTAG